MTTTREQQPRAFTPEAPVTLHQFGSSYGFSVAGAATHAPPRVRSARPRRWWPVVGGALLPLAILAIWWVVSASGWVPAYRLPSPPAVVAAAFDLADRGLLFQYVAISTQRVLLGFAFGSAIGLVLGALVGLSRTSASCCRR